MTREELAEKIKKVIWEYDLGRGLSSITDDILTLFTEAAKELVAVDKKSSWINERGYIQRQEELLTCLSDWEKK